MPASDSHDHAASVPPYSYREMCADLGHVLINWSGAEQALDMCVTVVFQKFLESHKFENALPRALNKKTTFMRKALRHIVPLKEFSELGIPVVDRIDKLANDRNDMIHAALSSTHAINGKWQFRKFDYGQQIHTFRPVEYSRADYQSAGREMMDLANDVLGLYRPLRKFLPLQAQ